MLNLYVGRSKLYGYELATVSGILDPEVGFDSSNIFILPETLCLEEDDGEFEDYLPGIRIDDHKFEALFNIKLEIGEVRCVKIHLEAL